jgi:hypothetical protein
VSFVVNLLLLCCDAELLRRAVTSRRRHSDLRHLRGQDKPFQTNFDSNVAIRTFDHEHSAQKNKLSQTEAFFCSCPLQSGGIQTESKGNFCLIIIYGHKTFSQPQNSLPKKQTFPNLLSASLYLCVKLLPFAFG